jgi:ribosomal protein S18 acetylase RimI-like enzyme
MTLRIHELPPGSSLDEIGQFRLQVWRGETEVNEALFPENVWIEPLDHVARHWVARDEEGLLGAARLTLHDTLEDNPDGYLWLRAGRPAPTPAAHLCKLVVHARARGKGIGSQLNALRIAAARSMGARSVLVTASAQNARLLQSLGFVDTGIREVFDNRPRFPFHALELIL